MSAGSFFTALQHGFPEHPKVMGLHDRAFRFHITALDWTGRNGTDGHIPARAVKIVAAILDTTTKRWPAELVEAKLWKHDPGGDGFWINDYLIYNPSAEALKQLSDKRRQAGIKGAEKRWRGEANAKANATGKSHWQNGPAAQMPALAVAKQELKAVTELRYPGRPGAVGERPQERQIAELTDRLGSAIGLERAS